MPKRERAYLLPSVLSPVARREICISIPDDLGHILPFLAQLEHLANWYAWEKNDTHDNDTVAAVWREIFDDVRNSIDNELGCGTMGLQDIRLANCVLEKQDNEGNWTEVGSIADCVVAGIDAALSDGTIPPSPFPDYPFPTTNAVNTTLQDVACGVADFASDYLIEKFNDQLDAIEAAVGLGVSVAKIAADVVDAIAGWAPVVGGIISAVKDVIEGSVSTGFAVVRASDTVDWRSDVKCIFYTHLRENGANFGADRTVIVDAIITEIKALSPVISPLFGRFLDGLEFKLFKKLAKVAEDNEGECDDCTVNWCYEWDFTTGLHGWTINYGTQDSSGLHTVVNGQYTMIDIAMSLPAIGHMTTVEVWGVADGGGTYPGADALRMIELSDSAIIIIAANSTIGSGAFHVTKSVDTTWAGATTFGIVTDWASPSPRHHATITKLLLRGTDGINPFGDDNCT